MATLADQQPYVPIGVALVDDLPSLRGSLTVVLNWRTDLPALVNRRGAK